MKKLLIAALILSGLIGAQGQTLDYQNSRKILLNGQKQSKEEIFKIMENNSEALQLYKKGKKLRSWGDAAFFGGLGIAAAGVLLNECTSIGDESKPIHNSSWYYYGGSYTEKNHTLSIVSLVAGGGMMIAAIPLKISGKNKIKQSVEKYNNSLSSASDLKSGKSSLVYNFAVINNNQGLGFRLTF